MDIGYRLNYFTRNQINNQGISNSDSRQHQISSFAEKIKDDLIKEIAIVELKKPENYDRNGNHRFLNIDLLKEAKMFDYKRHKMHLVRIRGSIVI